jgi:putative spermidine/putrescine transport system substrate-binding protein
VSGSASPGNRGLRPDEPDCETCYAGDEEFADQIWYWTTPIEQCIDGRTDVQCTDYGRWTQAWTEVKG